MKKLYDYVFKADHCYGNPYDAAHSGNPANWTCLTQAQVDARDDFTRQLLSALGDMTIMEPWYQCAFNDNQEKCDTLGEAISTFDVGGLARGGSRLARLAVLTERGMCSFTPGTRVLLKDGKTKPIGKVKPGDRVEAADPKTGRRVGTREVSAQLVHLDADLIDLTVSRNGRNITLRTTARHPFWDETAHGWVAAGRLTPGHTLNAADGHSVVVSVAIRPGSAEMYNLIVEQLHTYYVLAGGAPLLVHNGGGDDQEIPAIVQNRIEEILNGLAEPRLNAAGDGPDLFEVRTGRNATPGAHARKWGPSAPGADDAARIYDMGEGDTNRYRVLVNRYGNVGWVDNHNYKNIKLFKPTC